MQIMSHNPNMTCVNLSIGVFTIHPIAGCPAAGCPAQLHTETDFRWPQSFGITGKGKFPPTKQDLKPAPFDSKLSTVTIPCLSLFLHRKVLLFSTMETFTSKYYEAVLKLCQFSSARTFWTPCKGTLELVGKPNHFCIGLSLIHIWRLPTIYSV